MDLFSLEVQTVPSKKEIHGSQCRMKKNGGEKMEETEQQTIIKTIIKKEEIDWAKYLDHTKFLQPAEMNNYSQERFKRDYEELG